MAETEKPFYELSLLEILNSPETMKLQKAYDDTLNANLDAIRLRPAKTEEQ